MALPAVLLLPVALISARPAFADHVGQTTDHVGKDTIAGCDGYVTTKVASSTCAAPMRKVYEAVNLPAATIDTLIACLLTPNPRYEVVMTENLWSQGDQKACLRYTQIPLSDFGECFLADQEYKDAITKEGFAPMLGRLQGANSCLV